MCHLFTQQIYILRACDVPGAVTARDRNKNERHRDDGSGRFEADGSSKARTAGGWGWEGGLALLLEARNLGKPERCSR